MSFESKLKHLFYDRHSKELTSFDHDKLQGELDRIAKTIQVHLEKLEKIGNFELNSVDVTVGVRGDILVIGVDGGITLRYSKK